MNGERHRGRVSQLLNLYKLNSYTDIVQSLSQYTVGIWWQFLDHFNFTKFGGVFLLGIYVHVLVHVILVFLYISLLIQKFSNRDRLYDITNRSILYRLYQTMLCYIETWLKCLHFEVIIQGNGCCLGPHL